MDLLKNTSMVITHVEESFKNIIIDSKNYMEDYDNGINGKNGKITSGLYYYENLPNYIKHIRLKCIVDGSEYLFDFHTQDEFIDSEKFYYCSVISLEDNKGRGRCGIKILN